MFDFCAILDPLRAGCARRRLVLESSFDLDALFCEPAALAAACTVATLHRGALWEGASTLACAG
jgi:hypothetical protein